MITLPLKSNLKKECKFLNFILLIIQHLLKNYLSDYF